LVWVAAPFVSVVLAALTHHLVEEPLRGRVKPRQAYRELVPMLRGNGFHKWVPLQNAAVGLFAYALVLTSIAITSVPTAQARLLPTASTVVASGSGSAELPSETVAPEQTALTMAIENSLQLRKWPDLNPSLGELHEAGAPEWIHDNCLAVTDLNLTRCRYGPPGAKYHATVLGDSIAVSYLPGLRAALEPLGWDFQLLTFPVCNSAVPIMREGRPYVACDEHREWAVRQIKRTRPDLLIMSNVTAINVIVPAAIVGSPLQTWQAGLTRTLQAVVSASKRVVILTPPPGTKNPQKCATRTGGPSDCASAVSDNWDRMAAAEEAAAKAAGAQFLRTSEWFCAQGICPAVVGGIPVTWDGIHLSARYSRLLAPVMLAALHRAAATP
jgi:hypothetical protein